MLLIKLFRKLNLLYKFNIGDAFFFVDSWNNIESGVVAEIHVDADGVYYEPLGWWSEDRMRGPAYAEEKSFATREEAEAYVTHINTSSLTHSA